MFRGLAIALFCLGLASPGVFEHAAASQDVAVLRVRIALTGVDRTVTPIRRHLLLISDNPASAPPRRVFTTQDGTVEVRLRPGSYTVESDRPVAFEGRLFQWTQTLEVVAGLDTVLELTAANADAAAAPLTAEAPAMTASALDDDPSSLSARWQDSVVGVWTPTAHASGALIDAAGLVVTNQQPIGAATTVEVQFSPTRTVTGHVVVTDAERDVAVVRINPAAAASVAPVPLGCGQPAPAPAIGDEIVAIESPLRASKGAVSGVARRVATRIIESDLTPGRGGSGGPVFSTKGAMLGITSEGDARMRRNSADTRVVRTSDICAVVDLARTKIAGTAPPPAMPLPVEPARPYPTASLADPATLLTRHPPPQTTSAGFDITFLTPVHIYGGQEQRLAGQGRTARPDAAWQRARLATEFANWADYVADVPPVVFIRVTPKMVESVWMKLARGAAYTQGIALPAIKRLSSGFARMTVTCGDHEVTPIHRFVLAIEVSDTETVAEGFYAFAPDALTPACDSVRLELHAQKEGAKADAVVVDAKVLEQIWADFAVYRQP